MKRQKPKKSGETVPAKGRILFFDIIRILCVAAIVYVHSDFDLIPWFNQFFFADGYGPFNIYSKGLQGFAVYGMIFVSGAVLEYNYQGLEKLTGYLQFLFKRFIRLYPAFWMSLIVAIVLFPAILLQKSIADIVLEFTGFSIAFGQGPGFINPMGWFIGTIFLLYILFPWFSAVIRKYRWGALLGFCILSWGLRSLILTYTIIPLDRFWMWFPLCNAFEFCLGIYIIQTGWYPKNENNYPLVQTLSDLSFYVFLFHTIVGTAFVVYLVQPLGAFDLALAMNNQVIGFTLFYLQRFASILLVSWIAMLADSRIRNWILQRDPVRHFLTKN